MSLRLFEYAVILQPKYNADEEVIEDGEVIVSPTTVLSDDIAKVTILAGRAIPEEAISKLDRLDIAVRPF